MWKIQVSHSPRRTRQPPLITKYTNNSEVFFSKCRHIFLKDYLHFEKFEILGPVCQLLDSGCPLPYVCTWLSPFTSLPLKPHKSAANPASSLSSTPFSTRMISLLLSILGHHGHSGSPSPARLPRDLLLEFSLSRNPDEQYLWKY